ncbi:MAG TPA: hypothetical protein VGT61_01700 [Thermomicrobiales bacterium]|jgi:hypothetical protein|nr:hypothetical protein [Thermomicrobiales bacterium]
MVTMSMANGLGDRVGQLPRTLALATGWALVAGIGSIGLAVPAMVDGEIFGYTRAAIGVLGLLAAALVISGRWVGLDGRQALMLWTLAQLPIYADTEGGNLFRQLFEIPLVMTSQTTVNGVITHYSAFGLNLFALILLIMIGRQKDSWLRLQRERTAQVSA